MAVCAHRYSGDFDKGHWTLTHNNTQYTTQKRLKCDQLQRILVTAWWRLTQNTVLKWIWGMQTFAKQKWPSLFTLLLDAQLTTLMQSIEKGTMFRSKPTFKGFVCHRLVQGVDTNIFDWKRFISSKKPYSPTGTYLLTYLLLITSVVCCTKESIHMYQIRESGF